MVFSTKKTFCNPLGEIFGFLEINILYIKWKGHPVVTRDNDWWQEGNWHAFQMPLASFNYPTNWNSLHSVSPVIIKLLSQNFLSVASAPQLTTTAASLQRINFDSSWCHPFTSSLNSLNQVAKLPHLFAPWGNTWASLPMAIPRSSNVLRFFFSSLWPNPGHRED